ncbi:MAG: TolC family protein [Sulfurovum sp.]|uniref:TolC family protein n=1 Tax=Sulfurovum sp. TaxID=1969726 RepID=UPI003C782114
MKTSKKKRVKMRNSLPKIGLSVLTIVMMSGCTKLGPDFLGVENPPVPAKWQKEDKRSDEKIAQWWKSFNDPVLNTLVEKAYAQNLNIKSAGLRILQARAALGISEGLAFPQVQTLSGNAAAVRSNGNNFEAAGLNFDMGWEMDIWGKYARNIESSEANLYASLASYNDIMVSVIAEVARNYIDYRTAQERIAYARRNVQIQERVTQMTEVQFNSGNVSELDMQQSRSQLYNTRAAIPTIAITKVNALNAMALLLGTDASVVKKMLASGSKKYRDATSKYLSQEKRGVVQIKQDSSDLLNVEIIPMTRLNPYNKIDAGLLTRRPDIKVAEYRVRSNSAVIGSSMAELYPSFSLFGNIGLNSNNASGSWVSGSNALGVTIGPAFSWNIFQYGRIKNQIRLQDAVFEESLVNYNNSVLTAVSEVSNALESYTWVQKQQKEIKNAVDATVRAFNISVIQYNDGLVSYQRLLNTVEKLTSTQDRYANIKGNLSLQTVAFYKALGGGWQISKGRSYLSEDTAEKMKQRVDWDRYLDENMTRLPEGMK